MIRTKFKFKIKYVKSGTTKNGDPLVRFQIGDAIKDAPTKEYINYQVTVFNPPDLHDGDQITIESIDSLEVRSYNSKLFYSFIAKIAEQPQEEQQKDEQFPDADQTGLPFDL